MPPKAAEDPTLVDAAESRTVLKMRTETSYLFEHARNVLARAGDEILILRRCPGEFDVMTTATRQPSHDEAAPTCVVAPFNHRPPRSRRRAAATGLNVGKFSYAHCVFITHGTLGFRTVGVNSSPAWLGVIPNSVAWVGLLEVGLETTSPPARRTCPTVVTPTCRLGIVRVSSWSVAPGALFTETFCKRPPSSTETPVPVRKRSAVHVPPRHTIASSGSRPEPDLPPPPAPPFLGAIRWTGPPLRARLAPIRAIEISRSISPGLFS